MTVIMAPTSMGVAAPLGQCDVVLPLPITLRARVKGVFLAMALCHNSYLSPRCLLRHMQTIPWACLRWVFFFRVEPSADFLILVSDMVSAIFRFQCGCHVHQWGHNNGDLHHCNPSQLTHSRHMCFLGMVINCHGRNALCGSYLHCFE